MLDPELSPFVAVDGDAVPSQGEVVDHVVVELGFGSMVVAAV